MQARFLLGPAGSGKTFRCLAEVRAALTKDPAGAPLILLAPKQATFQLERQLLETGELAGFTRLQILSFDRLAKFIFEELNVAPPKLLSAEGRLMVLRALLQRHADELKLFRGSARRAGFAQELGTLLAELQQHQFTPAKLRALAANEKVRRELRDKLHDLALLSEKYAAWLREHELQDGNNLLDAATEAVRGEFKIKNSKLKIEALWLDGFAEMTPQELALLTAVVPLCEQATLAFCLETEPAPVSSWLSIWSSIGKTFQRCRDQLKNIPGCEVTVEVLQRETGKNRFAPDSELSLLEESWTLQIGQPASSIQYPASVTITASANPEAEAIRAAREILQFVRAGNRFRDCAVLVRQLDGYHKPLARIFQRYEIPFFLDRRESVAHHPLAELTRNALRTVAFDWQNDDWFAALKTGFSSASDEWLDGLENRALEFGWRGQKWHEPLPDEKCERLRKMVIPPFESFWSRLNPKKLQPTGAELAAALRKLWQDLSVETKLEQWTFDAEQSGVGNRQSAIHSTVWEQMNSWLENLELAFPREPLPLRDWLPILEAGLGNLTVGVIPPSLDEVLVGAIDRARNPSLKFALLLGLNEGVFPAPPVAPVILTHADRDELEAQNATFGATLFEQISRERYLGYIACTRANERLSLSFSRQAADGKTLNPSPFVAQVQKILPQITIEEFSPSENWSRAEHLQELTPLCGASPSELLEIPAFRTLAEQIKALREPDEQENLAPTLAEKLYGPTLKSSISRLEEFAQCPFKFFVKSGLRANERKVFELDVRERGNFQHDVLKIFHEQLQAEGQRWRDLTLTEARERIDQIARSLTQSHRDGLFLDSAETAFAARAMTTALQDFVEIIIGWMHSQYDFDPVAAEIGFGGKDDAAPAWEIDLSHGRKLALQGRIDRVDIWRDPNSDAAFVVVTDYKSGGKKLDSLLVENGVQLQLLAYLGALRSWKNPEVPFGAVKILPAGAFYVSLRGDFKSGDTRDEILGDHEAKKTAYKHNGRFDAGLLRKFDRRDIPEGDQFKYKLNKKDGLPSKNSEALPRENFVALVDGVENQLRMLGEHIFSGSAAVDPYRKGKSTPCEYCDYRPVCRIDEWTHEYRSLSAAEEKATE